MHFEFFNNNIFALCDNMTSFFLQGDPGATGAPGPVGPPGKVVSIIFEW